MTPDLFVVVHSDLASKPPPVRRKIPRCLQVRALPVPMTGSDTVRVSSAGVKNGAANQIILPRRVLSSVEACNRFAHELSPHALIDFDARPKIFSEVSALAD